MENIKLIDKYQIYFAHFLGKGSYASVYMAKNVETGEQNNWNPKFKLGKA